MTIHRNHFETTSGAATIMSGRTWRLAALGPWALTLLLVGSGAGSADTAAVARQTRGGSGSSSPVATQRSGPWTTRIGLSSLPTAAQGPISAVLGRHESRYWVHTGAGRIHAENPRHALAIDFTRHGIELSSQTVRWGLALQGYGYGHALRAVSDATPHAETNRVEYAHDTLTEWYVNGPVGLEQGFTFTKRPGRANGRPLTVALALSRNLTAEVDPDGTAVTLRQRDGQATLRFTGLTAHDATGRELRGWLGVRGEQLLLQVNDAGAQYPLIVDPFVQQAKLTASDGAASSTLGNSVAVSGDGSTVVVGAFGATIGTNLDQGAVYVFVRPASGWASATQTAKLTASDGAFNDDLGVSVGISRDGRTVVAGASGVTFGAHTQQGAVYVFVKPASGWASATQTAQLTASDGVAGSSLGDTVAVSGHGRTVVAGAPGVNATEGVVYVFLEPATGWANTTQTAELTASDGVSGSGLGFAVAIDRTGGTVVGGAQGAQVGSTNNAGAAYVFVEPTTGWASATQTSKLTASDPSDGAALGASVSINSDGHTVVAGASNVTVGSNQFQGAVYVFVKPASGWAASANQVSKLTASDGAMGDVLGSSVAISGNGNTVVAGAPSNTGLPDFSFNPGAVYVFVEPKTGWAAGATQTEKLTASDGADGDELGAAAAINSDGGSVVAGAPLATIGSNALQGAAYVFHEHRPHAPNPATPGE
jgi:trimeric autotransporter adhesin